MHHKRCFQHVCSLLGCSVHPKFKWCQKKQFPPEALWQEQDLNEMNNKSPLSSLFWFVRLTHQLFPSACHSREYNEPRA